MGHGHVLPQDGGNRRVLKESKYHGASEHLDKARCKVSTRSNTSSGAE